MFHRTPALATITFVQFGTTIRRRREALGLTLEELAERASLTPNYVGSVELGRRDPSLSTVLALAQALRSSPGDLLGARDIAPDGVEAARLFQTLTPDVQASVLDLLRTLTRRRR